MTHSDSVLTPGDEAYPRALLALKTPPASLYCRGDLSLLGTPCVAVVGSRDATVDGVMRAFALSAYLAMQGITIVSGMAAGIDAAAHDGALSVGGKTIAVLGTPLDEAYPPQNRSLQEVIGDQGLLVTEYREKRRAPGRFVRRDNALAALSQGVIAIEAALTGRRGRPSGTLQTVEAARALGRPVWVPPVPPGSTELSQYGGIRMLIESCQARLIALDDCRELIATVRA